MKDWVKNSVENTNEAHKGFPDEISDQIKSLLEGELSKDELTPKNLKTTANLLINAMKPKPIKVEPEENAD